MGKTTKKSVRKTIRDAAIARTAILDSDEQVAAATKEYQLTSTKVDSLSQAIDALGDDVITSPGRLHHRIQWATRIRLAAERDAKDLVQAPFFDEPPLTHEEIGEMRDQIEMLRATESRYQQLRTEKKDSTEEFDTLAKEAAGHKEALLRAFDLRFRRDPVGQKRVAKIREGSGDADLVQDVSDIVTLCQGYEAYLATCPRGEARSAKRLAEMSPHLTHLLGAKSLDAGGRTARRARDGAYTLMITTERRIRAAAQYWYDGTEKMKEYARYTPPSNTAGDDAEEPASPAQPA